MAWRCRFVAAWIGWVIKIVAIKMMFRPYAFMGIGPLGWRASSPSVRPQMTILCRNPTPRLVNAKVAERTPRSLLR